MIIIRLSPSGPPIVNSGGGPLQPGTGMMLRLAEGTTTIGGSLAIPSAGSPATIGTLLGGGIVLIETLDNPNPNLNYRATLLLDVANEVTNSAGEVQLYIDTSVDGSTWVSQVGNEHIVAAGSGATSDEPSGRQVRVDMTLRLGGSINGGMPVGSPSLRVRGRISATLGAPVVDSSAGAGDLVGSVLLQLSEHF